MRSRHYFYWTVVLITTVGAFAWLWAQLRDEQRAKEKEPALDKVGGSSLVTSYFYRELPLEDWEAWRLRIKHWKVKTLGEARKYAYQEVLRAAPELLHALREHQGWEPSGAFIPVGLYGYDPLGSDAFWIPFWIVRVVVYLPPPFGSLKETRYISLTLQELWVNAETGEVYPVIPWDRWAKEDTGKEYPPKVWELKPNPNRPMKPKLPLDKLGTRPQPP